jgi:mono/diheme cytochrome c family protein
MEKIMKKSLMVGLAGLAALTLVPALSFADGARVSPVTHEATLAECSACHMAYQPGFLPQASWMAIMSTLPDHFGEDASLDDATRQDIEAYLVANASDAGKPQATSTELVPLKISELAWFRREHGTRTQARAANDPKIGTMSNCVACHSGAERGNFDD